MTKEQFEKVFKDSDLKAKWLYVEPLLKYSIRAHPQAKDDGAIKIGASKLGGKPDMLPSQKWPEELTGKHLSFIGQVNFEEISTFDCENVLPKSGLALFFYSAEQEAWGFDPKDADKFKVLFYEGSLSNLIRHSYPDDVPDSGRYNSCILTFSQIISFPSWENEKLRSVLNDHELDKYVELTESEIQTKLLGYADNVQDDGMELECALVTNGLYCGDPAGYNDPRVKEFGKQASQWRLLFQIDSEEESAGMMWGDAGRLYYWIKELDLKNKQFDKCWLILQCG